MENKDGCVTERVTKKISTDTPSSQLVDAYLGEIAKGYGINWTPALPSHDDDNSGNDDGVKDPASASALDSPLLDAAKISAEARSNGARTPKLPEVPPTDDPDARNKGISKDVEVEAAPPEDDFEALARRFAALKKR
ncbi:hypothetical protein EW026_g4975 [Hermanssonia centrifuga]|uniref:Uncharacterized protein n=1 Tax=Hermanssonia centrifuga TaxID=98765 RepID=A0A4S4KHB1_9APHY|nr:hypothetical protein EW026_g4975 [Hermanssonia centrifuga]